MKISGRPPPTIPTAILIESGSWMRMAWQKMSISFSMSFPARPALKGEHVYNLYASRQEAAVAVPRTRGIDVIAYLWPSHNAPPFSLQWYHGEADNKTRLIRITKRSLSSYSDREGVSCRN